MSKERDGWFLGVEEELLIADPSSGVTLPAAPQVLRAAATREGAAPDAALHPELLTSQVEAATGRCCSLKELAGQLAHARRVLAAAAPDVWFGDWRAPAGRRAAGEWG